MLEKKMKTDVWMNHDLYKAFSFMAVLEDSKDHNLIMISCHLVYYEHVSEWNEIPFR